MSAKCLIQKEHPKISKQVAEYSLLQRASSLPARDQDETRFGSLSGIVQPVLGAGGQPLDARLRTLMESQFGQDFSQVRVHTDRLSAESARLLDARAYTVGHDIAFAQGEYMPATQTGRSLLAHELTHVVQQREVNSFPGQALVLREPRNRRGRGRSLRAERIERFLTPGSTIWRELNPDATAYSNCPATAAAVDEFLSTGRIVPAPPGTPSSEWEFRTEPWSPIVRIFRPLVNVVRQRPDSFLVIQGMRSPEFAAREHVTPDHYFVLVNRGSGSRHGIYIIDAFGQGQLVRDYTAFVRGQGFDRFRYYRGSFRVVERRPLDIDVGELSPEILGGP